MLGILFLILKIIGIAVLCILALILLLLIIFLVVPLRYSAKGSYINKIPKIKAKISYLLYIIYASVQFEKKLDYVIRIFGIKLDLSKLKSKKNNSDKTDSNDKDNSENKKEDETDKKDNASEDVKEEKKSITEKITSKKEMLDYYLELLSKDSTKQALSYSKDRIGKAIKSILPYKGHIYAKIGLANAGTTGKILGIYKCLYDYIGDVVVFYPVFDNEIIEVEFDLKGRIRAGNILYHLIRIYMDKNCRRLINGIIKNKKHRKGKV